MIVQSGRRCCLSIALVALLPVLTGGCYAFVPVSLGTPPLATNVRANLTEPGRQRLWAVVPPDRRYLDGKLVERDGDTLLVEVSIRGEEGNSQFVQRIQLSRDDIAALETRHIDAFRTAVAGGIFAAVATALVVRIFTGPAGGGAYPPPPSGDPIGGESVVAGFLPSVR